MPYFQRRRPILTEARQYLSYTAEEVAEWCDGEQTEYGLILLYTHVGPLLVRLGDWIVKEDEGVFYPCDPEVFPRLFVEVVQK